MEEQWGLIESSQKLWVGPIEGNIGEVAGAATLTTELQSTKIMVYDTEMDVFRRFSREGFDGRRNGVTASIPSLMP